MSDISQTLLRASPRLTPRAVPLRSLLIYSAVPGLWLLVFAGAFHFSGVLAWSVGLLYAAYDTILLAYVAAKTRFILDKATISTNVDTAHATNAPRPTLGVIVAARNEAEALPRTLNALFRQNDAPDAILVVDDSSDDATCAVLERDYAVQWLPGDRLGRSSMHHNLQVLKQLHGGKARALNAALATLNTDLVLTVDADTLLEPDAIAGMRAAFAADPKLVAAGGVLTPICSGGAQAAFFQWFQTYEYLRAFISRIAWMRAGALLLVSGAFAGFRRDAVQKVGGFDPDCLVEDYELIHRLHRWSYDHDLAWKVGVLNTAQGTTDAPASLFNFLRQRRRWFAGFLQTQWWNRDMTGNAQYGSVGTFMLPIKAIDTLQPIYGLTAFGLLVTFIVTGRPVLLPVLGVIGLKIVIDLAFHLWSVRLYAHLLKRPTSGASLGLAALAALAEPFSFQLMRHTGAAWGWLAFLRGRQQWGAG